MSAILKSKSKNCIRSVRRAFSVAQRQEPVATCFTWGQTGKESSLGLGEGVDDLAFPTELQCPDDSGFIQVIHGPKHSGIVTGKGALYTFGVSTTGQLGHGEAISSAPLKSFSSQFMKSSNLVETPTLVESLLDEVIVRVGCGTNHTGAVTAKGEVYTWGWGGPSWGFGCGGLGHGDKKSISIPKKIEALEGTFIVDVVVGDCHTLCLDDQGQVWACGEGEYGRLGVGGTSSAKSPIVLEFFDGHDESVIVDRIYAGKEFSVAQAKDGSLYAWGRNDRQQLGVGGGLAMDIYSCENSPEMLGIESGVVMAGLSASDCIAITDDNQILAWGDRQFLEPTPITEIFKDEQIEIGFENCGIAATYHAFVLKDGSLWTANKKISLTSSSVNCLGQGYVDPYREPRMVGALQGRTVKSLSCQDNKVSVLVD